MFGTPGIVDVRTGTVTESTRLCWDNLPLVTLLQRGFPLPAIVERDVRAAACGERSYGHSRNLLELGVSYLAHPAHLTSHPRLLSEDALVLAPLPVVAGLPVLHSGTAPQAGRASPKSGPSG
ncbi:MAG: ROK family protein [Firmicutes bacterium]|nr:ROK family protein [Bacillota bacterium]